jgi:hypothetical protein
MQKIMASWIAVLLLMYIAVTCSYPQNPTHIRQTGQGPRNAASISSQSTKKPDNGNVNQTSTPGQVTGEPKSVKIILPSKDRYDYIAFGANVVLAIVGIIGIGVGIWTLCYVRRQAVEMRQQRILMRRTLNTIRKQTKAAEDAAESSLLNAKALVNSERAWLIAEVSKNSQMRHFYEIKITNFGRTPARFIRGDAAFTITERPDLLSIPPDYSSPIVLPDQLLIAPNKWFLVPHGYNISHIFQGSAIVGKTLVIYGRVLYEDAIIPGIVHETRWCFGYITVARGILADWDFVLTGPNEYTMHT